MKVVSVINYKGGVGKTTLTANLGAYAAMKGLRVLMIDLDPQTHLTFSFMTPEYWGKKYADGMTLRDYFAPIIRGASELRSLSSLIIPLKTGNLLNNNVKMDLISSHLELINIDVELAGLFSGTNSQMLAANSLRGYSYLRRELDRLKDSYDLVLIDCPPNFYVMVKNAILASDYYIVPARLDYLSTLGVAELQKKVENYLKQYDEYMNILEGDVRYRPVFLTMLGVVPTMVDIWKGDEPITVQREYMSIMKKKGYHIFHYIRNNASLFGAAPSEGVPAVLTRPRFNLTAKRIVSELKILGDEFLNAVRLSSGSQALVKV